MKKSAPAQVGALDPISPFEEVRQLRPLVSGPKILPIVRREPCRALITFRRAVGAAKRLSRLTHSVRGAAETANAQLKHLNSPNRNLLPMKELCLS
jgi:hypothetical protein